MEPKTPDEQRKPGDAPGQAEASSTNEQVKFFLIHHLNGEWVVLPAIEATLLLYAGIALAMYRTDPSPEVCRGLPPEALAVLRKAGFNPSLD